MSYFDAFGVERSDLVSKAGPEKYHSKAGQSQRVTAGIGSALLAPVGAPIFGAAAAPKGRRAGAAARAFGRSSGEGLAGGYAGHYGGLALQTATKGKVKLHRALSQVGALGGMGHGAAASVGTTQRRHGGSRATSD